MKKLLSIILVLTIVGMGVFFALPTGNEEEETEVLIGLNGIPYPYTVIDNDEESNQGVKAAEDLDKNKLPTYLLDLDDNPISFYTVGSLLKAKYYGSEVNPQDFYKVGFQTKMRMTINDSSMTINEFMAKTVLLIKELSLYQYWLIGGSELYLQITFNNINFEIFVYMPNLLSDAFTLTPTDYYYGYWEIEVRGLEDGFNLVQTQVYYDGYVLNETFIGYVLNYE